MAQRKKSGRKTVMKRPLPQQQAYHFVVSGEVEYHEGDGVLKYAKTNMIHVEGVVPGKPDGITIKGLGKIQTGLQMHFLNHYMKSHTAPPTITYCIIISVSHLGTFTQEQFHQDVLQPAAPPTATVVTTAPVVEQPVAPEAPVVVPTAIIAPEPVSE